MATKTLTLDPVYPDGSPAIGTRITVAVDRDVAITGQGIVARKSAVRSYTIDRDGTFPTITVTPNDDASLSDASKGYALIIEAEPTPLGGITGGPWTVVITSNDADTLKLSDLDLRNVVGLPPNISLADTMARLTVVEDAASDAVATASDAKTSAQDAATSAANSLASMQGIQADVAQSAQDAAASAALVGAPAGTAIDAHLGGDSTGLVAVRPRQATKAVGQGETVVSVKDYGAIGNGTTDDTAAVQAAIDAAGVGGKVILPLGAFGSARFRCGPLTLHDYQTIEGSSGSVTRTATPTVELYFAGLASGQTAITMGAECTLRNIQVRGPGSATSGVTGVATSTTGATYDYLYVMSFSVGIAQAGTYYSVFNRCGWRSNAVGLSLTGCYNVNLNNPRFACQNEAATAWGTAIKADTVRPLTVNGGSIEEYGASGGLNITAAASIVTMTGTYWESNATTGPVGIKAQSLSSLTLNLTGHMVYMTGHASWVNVTGSTVKVHSKGHRFAVGSTSSMTPQAFAYSPGSMVGEIGPDDWTDVAKASTYHGQAAPTAGLRAVVPVGVSAVTDTVVLQGRAPIYAQTTATTNYTVTATDSVVVANSATAITISLPDPLISIPKGRRYTIKNRGAGVVTVNCTVGTRTIDGATSQTLNKWGSITVETDFASGWLIVGKV